jgi:hypothetical protein
MKTLIDRKIEEFDDHLSTSAPSMDKYEKAAALNKLHSTLEEMKQEMLAELDSYFKDLVLIPKPAATFENIRNKIINL